MPAIGRLLASAKRLVGASGERKREAPERSGPAAHPEVAPSAIRLEPAGSRGPVVYEQLVLRATLIVVGVLFVLLLAYQLRQVLLLLLFALIVGAALYGPSFAMERRGVPRIVAVLITYLVLIAVFVLLLVLVIPPIVEQVVSLIQSAPAIVDALRSRVRDLLTAVGGSETANDLLGRLGSLLGSGGVPVSGIVSAPLTAVSVLFDVVITFFLSALLLLERDRARRWASRFVDDARATGLVDLARQALDKLGAYVRGQLLIMLVTGVGTGIGMLLLGVPYVLPMSVLAFLTEAVPIVGPYIAGVPILLIALLDSPVTALLMLGWLVLLQQLEGTVLVPVIQGRVVSLSPAAVLLAVLAGTSLYGLVGAILAVPIVAVLHVTVESVVIPLRRRRGEVHAEGDA